MGDSPISEGAMAQSPSGDSVHLSQDLLPVKVVLRTLPGTIRSIPKLLQQREIYGKSFPLSGTRAFNRLRHLKMPSTIQIKTEYFDLMRDSVFLGMSNDSAYVVTILHSSGTEIHAGGNADMVLVVMLLSATRLIPAFTARLTSDRLFEVFAMFPRDNSFISVLSFTENVSQYKTENVTTLVALDFVLFKTDIHLSMRTSVVLSARWKNRISRCLMRCFNKGMVLNAGTMLVCVAFSNTAPPIDHPPNRNRSVFQVALVDDPSIEEWSGVALQEIRLSDARPTKPNMVPRHYCLHTISAEVGPIESHNMKEPLFVTESVLNIEKVIHTLGPKMVKAFLSDHVYLGLVDYEVDVLGCDGATVFVMVTFIIELKTPGASGINRPHMGIIELHWNTSDGTLYHRCWKPLKPMLWDKAHRPAQWYPFLPKKTPAIDEIVLSNEAFLAGDSLKMLISPFPGIGLLR